MLMDDAVVQRLKREAGEARSEDHQAGVSAGKAWAANAPYRDIASLHLCAQRVHYDTPVRWLHHQCAVFSDLDDADYADLLGMDDAEDATDARAAGFIEGVAEFVAEARAAGVPFDE